jgi:hypothetical protein
MPEFTSTFFRIGKALEDTLKNIPEADSDEVINSMIAWTLHFAGTWGEATGEVHKVLENVDMRWQRVLNKTVEIYTGAKVAP